MCTAVWGVVTAGGEVSCEGGRGRVAVVAKGVMSTKVLPLECFGQRKCCTEPTVQGLSRGLSILEQFISLLKFPVDHGDAAPPASNMD